MFDVAFSELVVIGVLALMVLGPKRLPEVARTAGHWLARLRHFIETTKRDMDLELRSGELAELRQMKDQLLDAQHAVEQAATDTINPPASTPDQPAPAIAAPRKRAAVRKKKKSVARASTRRPAHGRRKR